MAYRWRPEGGDERGLTEAGLVKEFDSQAAAEEWLTAFFQDLLERGVDRVSLYEEDRLVYGPMSLHP